MESWFSFMQLPASCGKQPAANSSTCADAAGEGFKYELVVVMPTNCKGNDISALQVQNGTKISCLRHSAITRSSM